jgi:hypothetical protein
MKSKDRGWTRTILLSALCAAAAGGCASADRDLKVVVLNKDHCLLLTPEQAPDAYALRGVKQVWRMTDVWLEEAHQIQMEAAK